MTERLESSGNVAQFLKRKLSNSAFYVGAIAVTFKKLSSFLIFFYSCRLCSNHHVAIWKRNVSNLANLGAPWRTLCRESEVSVEVEGGWALVEFRSGAIVSPYLYNGFRATVQFIHSGRRKGLSSPSSSSSGPAGAVLPTDGITIMSQPYPTRPSLVKGGNSNNRERTRNTGVLSNGNNSNKNNNGPQILVYTAPPPLLPHLSPDLPQLPPLFNLPSYDDGEDDNTDEPLGYPRASFGM